MTELSLAYAVRSYSTGTLGRAICNARNHHWVADDSGGEEIGAGELFLGGISACAVNMIERVAREEERPARMDGCQRRGIPRPEPAAVGPAGVRRHPHPLQDVGRERPKTARR